MIKVNELRIGNWLKYNEYLTLDDMLDGGEPNNSACVTIFVLGHLEGNPTSKSYDPIPLTEEWLIRFGFIKCFEKPFISYIIFDLGTGDFILDGVEGLQRKIKRQSLEITTIGNEKVVATFCRLTDWWDMENGEECRSVNIRCPQYIHQLQNLYFALTGEELKLKNEI